MTKTSRLKDVAEAARVSTATVSRVLNGLGPTSDAIRARVLRAVERLDYHPNWLAKSLRSRRTNTVGLVVPDIENPFFTSLVKGVERAAGERGWNVIFGNTDEDLEREQALVGALAERRVDGLLLCPVAGPHAYLTRHLERGLPMVAVNRSIPDVPLAVVCTDNRRGGYEALRHLCGRGLRRLALILGTPGISTTKGKLAGCRRAAREFGLGPDALLLKVGYGRLEEGRKAALEILDASPRPEGIFAFNNLMAEGALMAIRERGVRCPEEVAIVGFDDFRSAAAMTPPLTVVEQDPIGMGRRAVEVMAEVIETGQAARAVTTIPVRLVHRASCGCPAVG